MAIIGGIYFEMQTPGIGFPLGVALLAAVLYFAPLYLEGLAANWEIAVFILGIALVMIEIFVIPGFGITGVLGVLFIFIGLVLSLINNIDFDFTGVKLEGVGVAVMTVVAGIFGGFVLALYMGNKLFTSKSGPFKNLALSTVQNVKEGFLNVDVSFLLLKGKKGKTQTVLRPGGKVIIDDEVYDAVAENGFIDRNENVVVTRVGTSQVYVEKEE
jgi:membrane-bound serine protease (ClpP class)